jgi:hypothetical protein
VTPQQLQFYDICPVSLGISFGGGGMDKLILKSSHVPISVSRIYPVAGTDWSAVCLDVYAAIYKNQAVLEAIRSRALCPIRIVATIVGDGEQDETTSQGCAASILRKRTRAIP